MTQLSETRSAGWQKSSYSTDADGTNCLELASLGADILLRESADPAVITRMPARSLSTLLISLKAGRLEARDRRNRQP